MSLVENRPRAGATTSRQLATFFVADEMFCIDVSEVQEVLLEQAVTRVPLAAPHVVGLINLRGHIMPTIDLRTRLGVGRPRSADGSSKNLIVQTGDGTVNLIVDEIGDVVEVPSSNWREVPDTVPAAQRAYVREIYPADGRLILRLDLARVLDDEATGGASSQPGGGGDA